MIAIKAFQVLPWRNRFAVHPIVLVTIERNTARAEDDDQVSPDVLNLLYEHFPALRSTPEIASIGRWLAAFCLSMQRDKFDVPVTFGANDGQFWFAAVDPYFGFASATHAVGFIGAALRRRKSMSAESADAFHQCVEQCEAAALDQSTRALVAEAAARGIPWFRLDQMFLDIQLGQGRHQKRIRETLRSNESLLAASYAGNKALTGSLLGAVGLPVGRIAVANNPDHAAQLATTIGFPVVLKPTYGHKGVGVVVGLAGPEEVRQAARRIQSTLPAAQQLVVQSFIPGDDHRLLVVSGRLIAAARREPAAVVGDGVRNIGQLIDAANKDPRRGVGFRKLMNYIQVDDELLRVLTRQSLALSSIPAAGNHIRLRATANLSTGGMSADVTDSVHPDNVWLAERAAQAIGLTVAGVDFITPDITRSWREVGGGICEVNDCVGLRPHWLADPARDVVGPILDTVFPRGTDGRIPTALVTGSNGKTTTTRMLDQILRAAGHVVGAATTDGVTINGRIVAEGDLAGATGASLVLRDPTVSAAVLETARGGIVADGIHLDRCDVAALLNVEREQVEIDGIQTVEDMAQLKRKVVDTATGAVVFNAENRHSLAIARAFPIFRAVLFALDPFGPDVLAHLAAGGKIVTLKDAGGRHRIVVREQARETEVMDVDAIPAVYDGKVRHNIANALAAVALADGLDVPAARIAAGLMRFDASIEHSQGRFNFVEEFPATVLFDFAHNPPAIAATVNSVGKFGHSGRRICLVSSPGNRPDDQIDDCARAVAGHFDYYICFERVEWRRGRRAGEIAGRLADALGKAGTAAMSIASAATEREALALAAPLMSDGGLVVVLGTDVRSSLPGLRAACADIRSRHAPVG
ncbi:MAG: Mur ligase family protein [Alphaproteobacteria bacterium]